MRPSRKRVYERTCTRRNIPFEIQGQAQQITPPSNHGATQYIVVPSGEEAVDSIHYAAQLGRLDILTLLVAVIALVGFWIVRREVQGIAKDQAIITAEREARQEARQVAQDRVPIEVSRALALMARQPIEEDESDDPYAAAQEDGNDENA